LSCRRAAQIYRPSASVFANSPVSLTDSHSRPFTRFAFRKSYGLLPVPESKQLGGSRRIAFLELAGIGEQPRQLAGAAHDEQPLPAANSV
jgi:hypothetical protein